MPRATVGGHKERDHAQSNSRWSQRKISCPESVVVWTYHKVYVGASQWEGLHTHHLFSLNLHLLSFNFSIGGLGLWRGKRRERGREEVKERGGEAVKRKKEGGGDERGGRGE